MVRWDIVYNDFESNKPLDPIIVKEYGSGYYTIVDGRHRCILSHYNGYKYIPCNILDT